MIRFELFQKKRTLAEHYGTLRTLGRQKTNITKRTLQVAQKVTLEHSKPRTLEHYILAKKLH